MKMVFIFVLMLLCPVLLCGQERLSEMHGIVNEKGEQLFEIEGYTVSVYETTGSPNDEATIRLIEKAYQLENILMIYSDSTLKVENRIIEALAILSDIPLQISQKCLLLQKEDEKLIILYLETFDKRDFVLEEAIISACINGQLTQYATTEKETRSITLAGKQCNLTYEAEWIAPHKVVYEKSQMSWSEFSSESRAKQHLENQMRIDKADDLEYLGTDEINVIFDERLTTAYRVVYHDPDNETLADYLVIYYLVYELRGRYVASVLSHYGYSRDDLHLPVLLTSIMTIPSVSKSVFMAEQTEKPVQSPDKTKVSGEGKFINRYLLEFQAGSWMPVGNLRNVYKVAPSIGMYLGFQVNRHMGIDLGIQIAFPINSSFDYYMGSVSEEAEAIWLGGVNLRWRYQMKETGDVFCFSYIGAGVNWLNTDIESDYYWETDSYDYYSIASLDLFGGFNLRYKKVGFFVEYHFTPYGNSDEVKNNFGHSSFNLGVSFVGFRW